MSVSPQCPPPETEARRVIVVGGGYAGTTCSSQLGRQLKRSGVSDVEVLLIEPNPCQEALSELDLVAVGPAQPSFCELWHPTIFRDLPVRVCYNRVTGVDREARTVTVEGGQSVSYWRLVIATGAVPALPPIPGLADHALTMWSVRDARHLQRRVYSAFRRAAQLATAEERRQTLAVTVIGGGATGVEIIGTVGALLPKRAADAGLHREDLRMTLVEGRPDILYDLPESLRKAARERLERMGVRVMTGSMVARVDAEAVVLEDGTSIPSRVVVYCGGAKADPHATQWGFAMDNAKRLLVGPDLKADGSDDVYVIGDVASARHPKTGRTLPMLAQMAIQEGPHVAKALLEEAAGRPAPPFAPHMRGEFVSIGPMWGVGWMYGLRLRGFPAIVMKRITYVKYWLQAGGVSLAWKRSREMLSLSR